jgi:choline dehydrogenase-like flavoprotein
MGNDHYDVLVIGSGPGSATTAARVAETGQRVLLLERGDFLPRERDNWNSRAYVVDGSFMPSIGAVNPTLTIIANALRVGDHIAERLGTTT